MFRLCLRIWRGREGSALGKRKEQVEEMEEIEDIGRDGFGGFIVLHYTKSSSFGGT